MVKGQDASDDISDLKKGRHRAKPTPRSAFKMGGIILYLFSSFIIASVFLSFFIIYDSWLYQGSYEKLMNIWIQSESNQKRLDQLTKDMTNREITDKDMSKKIENMKKDIQKQDDKLDEIKLSNRYLGLVTLKKELALLTGDLYKVCELKDEVASEMNNNNGNKALLGLNEQNLKTFKREEKIVKNFQNTLPFERKIYEGLSANSLLAAIKGS